MRVEGRRGIAVLALSERGLFLALRLRAGLPGEEVRIYAPAEGWGADGVFSSLDAAVAGLFPRAAALVFIMAVGIAVRLIAPHLRNKFADPSVVVVDEAGRFAVSLVGGHHGGNALAAKVAAVLGAEAVITTASDVCGRPAIDLLASRHNLGLEPRENLPGVAAALLRGEAVAVLWDEALPPGACAWPDDLPVLTWRPGEYPAGYKALVVVTEKSVRPPALPYLFLRPRRYLLGVGCRRGVAADTILTGLATVARGRFSLAGVLKLATIDRKKDEPGLRAAAERLGVPLVLFSTHELKSAAAPGAMAWSTFVERKVGVGNVCERAVLAAGARELLVPKTVFPGVTVAVGTVPWP